MADPSDPIEPTALVPLGLPGNLVLGGPGTDSTGASPVIQALTRNLLRNFGPERRGPRSHDRRHRRAAVALLPRRCSRPIRNRGRCPYMAPEFAGGLDPLAASRCRPDHCRLHLAHGGRPYRLRRKPAGSSIIRAGQMSKALSMPPRAGLRLFQRSPDLRRRHGWPMILFDGSMSRDMTRWMIQRYQEKAPPRRVHRAHGRSQARSPSSPAAC